MKRKLAALLICSLVAGMTACGGGNTEPSSNEASSSVAEQTTESTAGMTENASANEEYFIWDGTIIEGLTELGAKQEELVIPAKCTGFKSSFLDEESSVKKVSFEDEDDVTLNLAFVCAETLTAIELPEQLSVIAEMEFVGCDNLKEIRIPKNVQMIGWNAFGGCKSLVMVDASDSNIREIPDNAFILCEALQEVRFPDTLEKIGASAFEKTGLETVTLPSSIKEIGELAFAGCPKLTAVYIPESVEFENVDSSAFTKLSEQPVAHVVKGSWADLNFDQWCGTMTEKVYD